MKIIRENKLLQIVIGLYALVSITILFMPYTSERELSGSNVPIIITGIVFWVSIIAAYIMTIILFKQHRKKYVKSKKRPGFFCFFSNPLARVVDSVLITSVFGFMLCLLLNNLNTYLGFVLLASFIFCLHIHCLVNSKLFEK